MSANQDSAVEDGYLFHEWMALANQVIRGEIFNALSSTAIGGWTENHITTQVLKELTKLGAEIDWRDYPQKVNWKAYKYTGAAETTYGDMAIFVRVYLDRGVHIDGVAYYEAKRQYFNASGKPIGYLSIDLEQMQVISDSTYASHVVLYDIVSGNAGSAKAIPTPFVRKILEARKAAGHSMTLDASLRTYGLLWVERLGNNLLGFDLDFREEAVLAVRNFVRERPGVAVINAGVAMNKFLAPDPAPFAVHNIGYRDELSVPDTKDAKDDYTPKP